MFCSQCGIEVRPGKTFCGQCGAASEATSSLHLDEDTLKLLAQRLLKMPLRIEEGCLVQELGGGLARLGPFDLQGPVEIQVDNANLGRLKVLLKGLRFQGGGFVVDFTVQ